MSFLLAAATIAWGVLVALGLVLSVPGLLERNWLLAGQAVALAAAAFAWDRCGRWERVADEKGWLVERRKPGDSGCPMLRAPT